MSHKTYVSVDHYLKHKSEMDQESSMFEMDVVPVDANYTLVPLDKFASKNLEEMEENIQDKFKMRKSE